MPGGRQTFVRSLSRFLSFILRILRTFTRPTTKIGRAPNGQPKRCQQTLALAGHVVASAILSKMITPHALQAFSEGAHHNAVPNWRFHSGNAPRALPALEAEAHGKKRHDLRKDHIRNWREVGVFVDDSASKKRHDYVETTADGDPHL